MNRRWFAIRTQPRKELLARRHYRRRGFFAYLPQLIVTRRHARRVDRVPRPLFPGYLFLHLAPEEERWTTLASTIGAVGPVRFGDHHPPVPDWVIEGIRLHEDEHGFLSKEFSKQAAFKPGEKVVVLVNHLEELTGIFHAKRGEDRALILLDILRSQVPTEVPLDALRAF